MKKSLWISALAMILLLAADLVWASHDDGARGGICTIGIDCPPGYGDDYDDGYDDGYREPGRRPPRDRGRNPGRGYDPGPNGLIEYREEYVNRFYRDEYVDLMWLLRLHDYRLDGARVERVELRLRTGGDINTIYLMADGSTVAQETMPISWVVMRPNRSLHLNQNVHRLELFVRGKVFIDSIRMELRLQNRRPNPPHRPPPDRGHSFDLHQTLNQSFRGINYLELGHLLNIYAYQGYQIQSVTINGASFGYEMARATFSANSFTEGVVNFSSYNSSQTIYPRRALIVGRGADFLQLKLEGGLHINSISVRMVRF